MSARAKALLPVLLACLASAAPAGADNVALRVKPAAIAELHRFSQVVPEQFAINPSAIMLMDCFGSTEMMANLSQSVIDLSFHEMAFALHGDTLSVNAVFDIGARTHAQITKLLCVAGQTTCELSGNAQQIAASLDLTVSVSATGQLQIIGQSPMIDLQNLAGIEMNSTGCLLGDALELVSDAFGEWIVETWQDTITGAIEDAASAYLSDLPIALPERLDVGDYRVATTFSSAALAESTGLTVVGTANISDVNSSESVDAASEPTSEGPFDGATGAGGYQLAVTDSLANQALFAAWRNGLLSSVLSDVVPSIGVPEGGLLSQKLGLPAGSSVAMQLELGQPPTIDFGRSDADNVEIAMTDLTMSVGISSPGVAAGSMTIVASGRIDAGFRIAEAGMLILEPRGILLDSFAIAAGDNVIDVDPARLEQVLSDMAVPILAEQLATVPLAPALNPIPKVFVWLRQLNSSGGWMRAGFDLVAADPDDNIAPETLVDPPALVRPGLVHIDVSGADDHTPPPLVRFTTKVNGIAATEAPTFGPTVSFTAESGNYAIEIAAVDLTDNVDPTPVVFAVEVDPTPPQLIILRSPASVLYDDVATAEWQARDDRPGVTSHWRVVRLDDHGSAAETVASGTGAESGSASITNLSPRELYVLRITAEDQAGNVTSEEFGFSFDRSGCRFAGNAGGPATLALLVLAIVMAGRKRRLVVPMAGLAMLVMLPTSANAQGGIGTQFSGAVDGDGAAAFWNPAAMSLAAVARVDLGVNLGVIRLRYDAPETEGQSSTRAPVPQPFVGAVSDAVGKWRFGISAGVPYGAGVKWSSNQAESAITRFYAKEALIAHVVATPAVSYQVSPRLSLGAAVNLSYSSIRASFDKDFANLLNDAATGTTTGLFAAGTPELAAPIKFHSGGMGFGANLGVLAQPSPMWRIGASVHSPIIAKTSGRVDAEYPTALLDYVRAAAPSATPPPLNGDIDMRLDVPLAVFGAVAFVPNQRWEIAADYRYHNTSEESELDVIISNTTSPDLASTELIRGSSDRHSLGMRVIRALPERGVQLLLRGRVENNVVDESLHTPSNPDFRKLELGAGLSWQMSRRFTLRAHYSHYFLQTVHVDQSLHRPLVTPSLDAYNHPAPLGRYAGSADQMSLGLAAIF